MSKTTIVSAWFICIAACATGGGKGGDNTGEPDAGTQGRQDANSVTSPDAFVRLDGGVTAQPDAFVSQTPDASTQSLFCSQNSECTVAGECCVTLSGPQGFCAPGTVVFGECFPQ